MKNKLIICGGNLDGKDVSKMVNSELNVLVKLFIDVYKEMELVFEIKSYCVLLFENVNNKK